jgi:hypothetical protein
MWGASSCGCSKPRFAALSVAATVRSPAGGSHGEGASDRARDLTVAATCGLTFRPSSDTLYVRGP